MKRTNKQIAYDRINSLLHESVGLLNKNQRKCVIKEINSYGGGKKYSKKLVNELNNDGIKMFVSESNEDKLMHILNAKLISEGKTTLVGKATKAGGKAGKATKAGGKAGKTTKAGGKATKTTGTAVNGVENNPEQLIKTFSDGNRTAKDLKDKAIKEMSGVLKNKNVNLSHDTDIKMFNNIQEKIANGRLLEKNEEKFLRDTIKVDDKYIKNYTDKIKAANSSKLNHSVRKNIKDTTKDLKISAEEMSAYMKDFEKQFGDEFKNLTKEQKEAVIKQSIKATRAIEESGNAVQETGKKLKEAEEKLDTIKTKGNASKEEVKQAENEVKEAGKAAEEAKVKDKDLKARAQELVKSGKAKWVKSGLTKKLLIAGAVVGGVWYFGSKLNSAPITSSDDSDNNDYDPGSVSSEEGRSETNGNNNTGEVQNNSEIDYSNLNYDNFGENYLTENPEDYLIENINMFLAQNSNYERAREYVENSGISNVED